MMIDRLKVANLFRGKSHPGFNVLRRLLGLHAHGSGKGARDFRYCPDHR